MRRWLRLFLFCCLPSSLLHADGQPFDLSGPKVDVHVKRGDVTLPIAEVPNLLPGDRLWVHPDLPESQAAHFVLVVAFLRGSMNPPPPEWFTRVETWTREAREEGAFITVPNGAQQAVLFLAPETGGDFNTLRSAVRGRPGSFVRAAQDLQAVSWERMRLEAYLADVKASAQLDPALLKTRTEMAARSLGIKINESCFLKPIDQQASCLSQNSEGMVLDDANAQSFVNQLASGSTLDLMNQLSYSTMGGGGAYSPYIGAIVDTAKILASLHTAHFQYIPALALPTSDSLNLRLNMPPSFRNPKSVVVVALPPVGPAPAESLHSVTSGESFCALKPGLVLPAAGAPLVFGAHLAHDLVLHVEGGDAKGGDLDIPLLADADRGGLVPAQRVPPLHAGEFTGIVRGKWGFDNWQGPQYKLISAQQGKWTIAVADQSALVIGRDDLVHIDGRSSDCVEEVKAIIDDDRPISLDWKSPQPGTLEATIPLKDYGPGPVKIEIYQYGLSDPDRLSMVAYVAAASLNSLTLRSGDSTALLRGTRLDEVANAQFDSITFTPSALNRVENLDQLLMTSTDSTSSLLPGKPSQAWVHLKDGRTLKTQVTVEPPRPQIVLLSKAVQPDPDAPLPPVEWGSPDDLPIAGKLVFFLQSKVPSSFPRGEKIELAGEDTDFDTTLSLDDGGLMLEDAHTAVATLQPLTRFGSSAFGPVHVRAIAADGAAGDWIPLGRFVRLPAFKELRCPRLAARPCILGGSDLFLASSIAATSSFSISTDVPQQFAGDQLAVPHPSNGVLYLKLRDDPSTVQSLTLPVTLLPAPAPPVSPSPAQAPPPAPAPAQTPAQTPVQTPAQSPSQSPPAPAASNPASPPAQTSTPTPQPN